MIPMTVHAAETAITTPATIRDLLRGSSAPTHKFTIKAGETTEYTLMIKDDFESDASW